MPTSPNTVVFVAPCDTCEHPDATWFGTRFQDNNTVYEVACPVCEGPRWTLADQIARRVEVGGIKSPLRSVDGGAVPSTHRRPA